MALFYRYTEEKWVVRNGPSLFKTEQGSTGQMFIADRYLRGVFCFAESRGAYSYTFRLDIRCFSFSGRYLEARAVLFSIQGLILIAGTGDYLDRLDAMAGGLAYEKVIQALIGEEGRVESLVFSQTEKKKRFAKFCQRITAPSFSRRKNLALIRRAVIGTYWSIH